MERFVSSIEQSNETQNWNAALTMVLTLPDVCGRLADTKISSQKRYEAWFDRYLLPIYKSPFHGALG